MFNIDISKEIESITTREKMIRYLDGYSAERMEELDERRTKRPLVKSYMLEHTGDTGEQKKVTEILGGLRVKTEQIDENLYRILDTRENIEYMGFLEILTPRYFVFYTLYPSDKANRWVKNLVFNSAELDHVWLSGLTFNVLWERVSQLSKPNRYVTIVFVHESIYQVDSGIYEEDEEEEEVSLSLDEGDVIEIVERRESKFKLVDRISIVKESLSKLQTDYSPLYAISQLRFPSPVGRGGHDFYDNGKVTNRSGKFRDHRNHILYVQRIYDELMKITQEKSSY